MSMLFALVLFGCADDGTQCERLAMQPERYSSRSECKAQQYGALDSEVARRSDYPTVVVQCLRARATGSPVRAR